MTFVPLSLDTKKSPFWSTYISIEAAASEFTAVTLSTLTVAPVPVEISWPAAARVAVGAAPNGVEPSNDRVPEALS
jgi:hypothetical protein